MKGAAGKASQAPGVRRQYAPASAFALFVAPYQELRNRMRRANAYREAGADCLFVPGVENSTTIVQLARLISGPINILARAGTPPLPEPPGWAWRA